MKKYLISPEGTFYKANLHCHTTWSDGAMTSEEIKNRYMEKGYSIVAFTDHCLMIPRHKELSDENFLALNAYENEIRSVDPEAPTRRRCCHLCFISLKEDNITMPYYAPQSLWGNGIKNASYARFNKDHTLEEWDYTPEFVNRVIRLAKQQGFFVTYNHPGWSVERYPQYSQYAGMDAMEIFNYDCILGGYGDHNPRVYEDFLELGQRIFAIGTDDCHLPIHVGGSWTMIKAPSLQYESVTNALVRGDFYASNGPEIQELWMEEGKVHIRNGEARRITCSFPKRRPLILTAADMLLTEAEFPILPSDGWFRLTVEDENGCLAHTNAYFTDEVL